MNVPKLRFKADDGKEFLDWGEKLLGDIGVFIKGASLSKADISETGNPFILYGELYTTYSEVAYGIKRKTEAIVDKKYYSKIGDVVIPTSGESSEEISTATCVMVPNVILAGDLNIFRSNILDGRIVSYILNHQAKNRIATIAQGKSIVHVQAKELAKIKIKFPSDINEQRKIATFLSTIDDIITSTEAELIAWEERKKGVMQKIFNREVRFKADDGSEFRDWEEKTVSDLFLKINDKNTKKKVANVITNSAEFGLVRQRDFFDKDIAVEGKTDNYTIIQKGDFVYNPRKSKQAPYGPFNCYYLNENGIVSPLYVCLRPIGKADNDYLYWYFQTDRWHSFIYENGAQNGARHDRVGMTDDLMKNIPIYLPADVSEQKKIADCLFSLDDVINQIKAELSAWKEFKKGLLQQMFV